MSGPRMTKARNRAGEGRFLAAMQHDDHQPRPTRRKPNGRAGWIAFALGMTSMFAIMAIWVAVVEMGDAPSDEVQLISRSEAIDDHGRNGGSD